MFGDQTNDYKINQRTTLLLNNYLKHINLQNVLTSYGVSQDCISLPKDNGNINQNLTKCKIINTFLDFAKRIIKHYFSEQCAMDIDTNKDINDRDDNNMMILYEFTFKLLSQHSIKYT
eukprot:UN01537